MMKSQIFERNRESLVNYFSVVLEKHGGVAAEFLAERVSNGRQENRIKVQNKS